MLFCKFNIVSGNEKERPVNFDNLWIILNGTVAAVLKVTIDANDHIWITVNCQRKV
jgi:hypothetical protein